MVIIDFHTHLGTSNSGSFDIRAEPTVVRACESSEILLASMDRSGVNKSVVFSVPMLPHKQREANYEVLRIIEEEKRLIPFAFVDPRLDETPELLEELIDKGCEGVKLHPICHGYLIHSKLCYPTMEVAQQYQLPVLIHTGWGEYGEIRWIRKFAKNFKQLNIVIGHLKEYKDIFEMIPPYDNVSVETSYSCHPRRIDQAVRALGGERVLLGSDFPLSPQEFNIYKVEQASISTKDKEKILYKNAARLLKYEIT